MKDGNSRVREVYLKIKTTASIDACKQEEAVYSAVLAQFPDAVKYLVQVC